MKQCLVLALATLLAACSSSSQHQSPAATAASAAPPAAAGTTGHAATAEDQPDQVVPPVSASQMSAQRIEVAIKGAWRPASDIARDPYRHPLKTLQFFGIRPDMKVIEITPGGGWYARILAPLLRENGKYIAAEFAPTMDKEAKADDSRLRKLFASEPKVFGKARIVTMDARHPVLGTSGSADMVLTFRNVHNWVQAGTAPAMFRAFYQVLKPGGVLGVVDHRAAPGTALEAVKGSGYLPQAYVIKLASAAGFILQAKSDVNANPRDTRDYPKGVWTLPPTLALGDKDKAKYQAIGESDRMTLRFVKPKGNGGGAR
jgi:predicted methyltransferase